MREGGSDVVEVMVFGKEVGLFCKGENGEMECRLEGVGLFERMDEVDGACEMMQK
ncbi:hypothetical protein, partial [Paenibacillus xylanexedens]|uniref:hypothetical protein n=1 Tax=Paenibacillus xylanexedens TaxID=528191 RepID=UPI0034D97C3D